jgi:hypothetical protein
MIVFGTGTLICVPTQDALGVAIANPTPVRLGTLQDVSVDLGVDIKTLYGSGRYPVAVGAGKAKTDIKAKYADINAAVLGSLFYGKTASAAIKGAVIDQTGSIPTTPFQITIAPPSSGTFVADLGVYNASTGNQLTRVASGPTTGQYSVNTGTGVYTFASADTGQSVLISYEYTAASGGSTFNLTNDLMGYTPSFSLILQEPFDGKKLVLKFNKCTSGKLTLPFKNEDFAMYDFEATGYVCLF